MVIGIIGAGFSGLIAGKRLAQAGHDVTVIEKNNSLGGTLATINLDGINLDYGHSCFTAKTKTFQSFVDDFIEKGLISEWSKEFGFYDGLKFYEEGPNSVPEPNYIGAGGMQSIIKELKRWVDVKAPEQAGGLTFIGPDRTKKRSWMINLTDRSVFECDAVILAAPATEALGVLQTAQDETAMRKIISHIDGIRYDGSISLAASYQHEAPDWKGIQCENSSIRWISNESTKQEAGQAGLVIRLSPEFFRKYAQADPDGIQELLLEEAASIIGPWVQQPESTFIQPWRYFNAQNPMNEYFMELEMEDAPLALIGNYYNNSSVENAYLSAYNLAEYWIAKYDEVLA